MENNAEKTLFDAAMARENELKERKNTLKEQLKQVEDQIADLDREIEKAHQECIRIVLGDTWQHNDLTVIYTKIKS